MGVVLRIDDVQMTSDDIVNYLKFSGEFDEIADRIVKDKMTVLAAKQRELGLSGDELQQAADDYRRSLGMHRAKDTQEWLSELNVTAEDLETFVTELMLKNKMVNEVITDKAVDDYFALHSPQFETADIKHIVVQTMEKAKEIMALLDDDPDMFDELVKEHTLDEDTQYTQGRMMNVRRGTLSPDLEAKVFNASVNDVVGPVQLGDEDFFEIACVLKTHPADLNDAIKEEVGKAIYETWLQERAKDTSVSNK